VAVSGLLVSWCRFGFNDRFREKQPVELDLIGQYLYGRV